MNINLVLIIDFCNYNISNIKIVNYEQKNFSFCSMIIKWLLKLNINQKIAVVINRGKNTEQICHFTNNFSHHIQGFRRIFNCEIYGKHNIKSSILLAKRLINFTNQKNNSEILLISSDYNLYTSLHFLGASLIKNNIKFSVIEFNKKTFFYETVCKLTGGLYVNYNLQYKLQEKNKLFSFFKYVFYKKTKLNASCSTIGIKKIKFFIPEYSKKIYLNGYRILNYCSNCKIISDDIKASLCLNCGTVFLKTHLIEEFNFRFLNINIQKIFSTFAYEFDFCLSGSVNTFDNLEKKILKKTILV